MNNDKKESINFQLFEKFVNELKNKHLKGKDEIFLSEDDLKFSFGQAIKDCFPDSDVILEYPVSAQKLWDPESKEKEPDSKRRCYIDVYFKCKYEGETFRCFVELKFITNEVDCDRHDIKGTEKGKKPFTLRNHAATNFRLYSIYKDIKRMEKIKEVFKEESTKPKEEPIKSFVLVITNQKGIWENHKGVSKNYLLLPGDKTSTLKLVSEEAKNSRYNPENIGQLKNEYTVEWNIFKNLTSKKNGSFKWLLIDLNEKDPG